MRTAILAVLSACVNMPHVASVPRSAFMQEVSVVTVESRCVFEGMDGSQMEVSATVGTGVIISERHVLTAAHVVGCPGNFPDAHVIVYGGGTFRMNVERDERTFEGKDDGLARLVVSSASKFGLGVPPPALGVMSPGDHVVVRTRHGSLDGRALTATRVLVPSTRPGDSGAPTYNDRGELVGQVLTGGPQSVTLTPVDATWLKGT